MDGELIVAGIDLKRLPDAQFLVHRLVRREDISDM